MCRLAIKNESLSRQLPGAKTTGHSFTGKREAYDSTENDVWLESCLFFFTSNVLQDVTILCWDAGHQATAASA